MITLHVEPRIVKTWDAFRIENPPYSIALDGYVYGRPEFDREGPYRNFNHHEGVDRSCTRATCAQVFVALKQELFDTFKQDGEPYANVYVNDPDQDTSVAVWLLQNGERIQGQKSEPLINRLVGVEDHLDATAGAYPLAPDMSIMRELAWIFEPYTDARITGRLPHMDEPEMRNVIESVGLRITKYSLGQGEKLELDTSYEELGGGPGWKLINETGAAARIELFASGTKAFVAVRDNGDSTYTYTLGKMSEYIDFPIIKLYERLNNEEGLEHGGPNSWGGGDTIGGSPRMTGSKLKPEELERIVNEVLATKM